MRHQPDANRKLRYCIKILITNLVFSLRSRNPPTLFIECCIYRIPINKKIVILVALAHSLAFVCCCCHSSSLSGSAVMTEARTLASISMRGP